MRNKIAKMLKRQTTDVSFGGSKPDLTGVKQPSAIDRQLLKVKTSTMEWVLFILASVFLVLVFTFILANVFQERLGIPESVFRDKGTLIAWLWVIVFPGVMLICFSLALSRHQQVSDEIERGEMEDVRGVLPAPSDGDSEGDRELEKKPYTEPVDGVKKFTTPSVAV